MVITTIERVDTIPSEKMVMDSLHISVRNWISNDLGRINDVQKTTIPRLMNQKHTLVMAPTGAGKTLAAFLGIISKLCTLEDEGKLEEKIYVLYISPLKALNNDIHKNLEIPLQSIKQNHTTNILAAKRTGDTTTKERARMLKHPPHILITTPESLALMLTAPKFKDNLRSIKWIIVDEIHALADNKRGSLLSLCLERLEYYLPEEPTRLGLSATVEPPEMIAHYLIGNREATVGVVNMGGMRKLEVNVISPTQNLVHAPMNLIQRRHREIITDQIRNHTTSLIFTNTRHLAEKMVLDVAKNNPDLEDVIAVHHGSLSKEVRLDVEERLKSGKMKAVFTSTSLELGIDIGSIDLTTQLGSPKTVRSFLQRAGRSGHSLNLVSKGNLLVFDRDDLIECMAIARLSSEGQIDKLRIPQAPTDVLFQMIIGMAVQQRWPIKDAYAVINKAYPYREMTFEQFKKILYAAANTTNDDNSWKYALIWYDEEIEEFGKRRNARQAYMQNIGTIPDVSMVDVILETYRSRIGQIADRFAENLTPTDIFVLGGKAYQYLRTVGNKILVKEVYGQVPTIPSWVGEAQSRTLEISEEISHMYETLEEFLDAGESEEALKWLYTRYHTSKVEGQTVLNYLIEQKGVSILPNLNRIIVEEYIDPSGALAIVILSIFGRETNLVLAQVLGAKISTEIGASITTIATDNGIMLRIPLGAEYDIHKIFQNLKSKKLILDLDRKIRETELFKHRFRHVAGRALMVLRRTGARKISIEQQMKQARWLVRSLPENYPILEETVREILYDTYNLEIAKDVLNKIEKGQIEIEHMKSGGIPSPMTHTILLNDNTDIVLMDDKKGLLLSLHQQVLSRLLPNLMTDSSIFSEEKINEVFRSKLSVESTKDKKLSVERFAEYPLFTDGKFIKLCSEHTGISEEEVKEIIANNDNIVTWLDEFTTKSILPFHAACYSEDIWDDYEEEFAEIKERSRELSPNTAIEYLIIYLLKYSGPINIEDVAVYLNKTVDQIKPMLQNLVRKHQVLIGTFISSNQEYMLYEDRELFQEVKSSTITLENLTNFRLQKLRLDKTLQSNSMSFQHYFDENGPARDTIELVARLPGFNWIDLRDELIDKKIYYGRFLARRLVFISKDQVDNFITVTRDLNVELDEITKDILMIIKENPGMTTKDIRSWVNQPNSRVISSLSILEQELYVSRVGWDLSLTQGGFPNPQYIALPIVKIDDISYSKAVEWFITQCLKWYGPLTLQDLLRITRLPYNTIEKTLSRLQVHRKDIFSYNYYGQINHFEMLEEEISNSGEVFLLSPLDPYFYMITGSLRQDNLPRHTQLIVVRDGKTLARMEITIPDKDILQVLNIQIAKRYLQDYDLLEIIAEQLIRIGGRAFQTQAVVIEEINFKAANHVENKPVVLAMKRVKYRLNKDHLIGGTKSSGNLTYADVIETRLITLEGTQKRKCDTVEQLFEIVESIDVTEALNLIENDGKLLLSRALRDRFIFYQSGRLTHHLFWNVLPDSTQSHRFGLHQLFLDEDSHLTLSEIMTRSGMSKREVNDELLIGIKLGLIVNISPFSKTLEYMLNQKTEISRSKKFTEIIMRKISRLGPLTFSQLNEFMKKQMSISRIEILLILADQIAASKINSQAITIKEKTTLIYFDNSQQTILQDTTRKQRLHKLKIYKKEDSLFEHIKTRTTHILTSYGKPIIELSAKIKNDTVILEEMSFMEQITQDLEEGLIEVVIIIEKYFIEQGYKVIRYNKIQSAYTEFWMTNAEI